MNIKNIKQDIQAFADDDGEVFVENNGKILFTRNGQDMLVEVKENLDTGQISIVYNGIEMPYRVFLAKKLANLDLFANKIIEKRSKNDIYVDGTAELYRVSSKLSDNGLNLLNLECNDFLFSGTKLTFITADAGHGKTALLKKYQQEQAARYLKNQSNFLFWHIDLQGRELVRLNEAIMYDLGELRLPGIYFSSILTLIKRKFIILAIDGFDELAAEIGGSIALGALSSLVAQMEGSGTLIAASRRTFFDTQDYLKRTKVLKGQISSECEFNEIKLQNWQKNDAVEFISYHYDQPEKIYTELLLEFSHNDNHPILTRPFLLTKVIEGMQASNLSPAEFVGQLSNPLEGVATVVEAFTKREVSKWKLRDKDTGVPYLTYEQHVYLLSVIAHEMWSLRTDKITIEEIQFFTTILCDDWKIEAKARPSIIQMVKSHALLILPSDTFGEQRKFEHEEFKNYFLARFLAQKITSLMEGSKEQDFNELKKFLYVAQLPDSVAQYAFKYIDTSNINLVENIVLVFEKMLIQEWKPTYLQTNVGTLLPYLLNQFEPNKELIFTGKANFTSLIFENKKISKIKIINSNFINISFRNTEFLEVHFEECVFNEVRIHISENKFTSCAFTNCEVNSVLIVKDGNIIDSAYAPNRIQSLLTTLGFDSDYNHNKNQGNGNSSNFKKIVIRFLNQIGRAHV